MPLKSVLDNKKDYLITSYETGASFSSLGKEFNCSECTVRNFLKKHIILRENPKKPKDRESLNGDIIRLHSAGVSAYQMSIDLGIPLSSLARTLKKLGLDISHRSKIRVDPIKNHKQEIISGYISGESESAIALSFKCDESSVSRLLKENGVETRFHYDCNHDFFSIIDSEVKAYILGYFTADGHNHSTDNTVSITSIDLDILERMKLELSYDGPIYKTKPPKDFPHRGGAYRLTVCSSKMSLDLTNLYCMPNKTFLTKFPEENLLPKHLHRHYIRGLLDGDGSIFLNKLNRYDIISSIAGTKLLLEPILDIVRCEANISGGGLYVHDNIYIIRISGNVQALKFLDWLYADATIFLQRKHDIYSDFRCKYYGQKPKYIEENIT